MRAHRFEPLSLILGLLFAGGGLLVLTSSVDLWRIDWSWFWPVILTLSGVVILLSLRSGDERQDEAATSDDLTDL